jgi:D-glycero-alpha-D-manno-heptose-7-phosphate kinase
MIVTKTPLRIGLLGGGSDMPSFFKKWGGCCINATIDKYVYVLVRKRFDDKIYLKYSENEVRDIRNIDNIEHDFIRETLKLLEIDYGIEIINWADIPTRGTGLGSSSSFLVGLLLALHTLEGNRPSKEQLAREACHIEIQLCGKPIGYQDQYAAAYGGLNRFDFYANDTVDVLQYPLSSTELLNLTNNMMMFYTGSTRPSSDILTEQNKNLLSDEGKIDLMKKNVELAYFAHPMFIVNSFDDIGEYLNDNWELKKAFANGISNSFIDKTYNFFKKNGVSGGKITGAGGGGFWLLSIPEYKKDILRKAVSKYNTSLKDFALKEMPFRIDNYGTRVLMDIEEHRW